MHSHLPPAVVFDCDGTLVDVSSIRYLVDRTDPNFEGHRQFDRFHAESIDCPPIGWVVDQLRQFRHLGYEIVIMTGRAEKHREVTWQWLNKHGICTNWQMHRPDDDFRADVIVKQEMLDEIRQFFNPVWVYDDNPHVVPMWQANGLGVTVVPGWPVRDGEAVAATSEKEYADSASNQGH